ncbi:penicillin-binding protein 2 [Arthrobacter sp. Marseille-P9274]|uniref:peptidoglycan D,D-transpeptidase FtsI family protein n=1 Tax=Arthrobacter sp. Marseille-P9274 TaxID=2866572 RepID=UPI0021C7624F|nr:penicillin-binding protein 2 [Arthrobacter sp. Marseille-P9274]
MNQAIRNTWIIAIAMFALLFGSLTVVQFFEADDLNANDWNSRTLYKDFDKNRGAILVAGNPIAESVPSSDDEFEFQRVYNDPELYGPLTGFYSLVYGATQMESAMNGELSGSSNDFFYDRILQLFSGSQVAGASVELTIDPELQKLAYDSIPDGVKGSIVVMEPKTGNILAMVSKPSFDPNQLAGHNTDEVAANMAELEEVPGLSPFTNPATESLLAPGSVFKLVDTAAALESGKYDENSKLDNPAELPLPGTNVSLPNFVNGGCSARTTADFSFALEQSCNTPFAQIAMDLGEDAIADQAAKFGFGESYNIPVNVTASQFPTGMSDDLLAQAAIGQYDVRVTPLQVAMMTSAIANDGMLMKPNLVRTVRAPDLRVLDSPKPEELQRSLSAENAQLIQQWMVNAVDRGIANRAAIPGVEVAGKTGTAELLAGSEGNNSWFTGFAPADDPEAVVSVVIEDVDLATGSQLTSPSARQLLEAVLNK